MKKIKSLGKVFFGCLIIAIALNLFFIKKSLIAEGILGFSLLYSHKTEWPLALVILLTNIFMLALGYITISKKYIKKSIIPFFLIPILVYVTKDISNFIDISEVEYLLVTVFGGALIGIGHSYIYKEGYFSTGTDIFNAIGKVLLGPKYYLIGYSIDLILLIFSALIFGIDKTLYSLLSIVIIEVSCKRAKTGISDSKVFYIITKKEREVKNFILNELHYDLTEFDVKGGFSKNKNRVLMSAIPTKEYYKLKEGVKEIDPSAFISITDSYELINQNVSIKRHLANKL